MLSGPDDMLAVIVFSGMVLYSLARLVRLHLSYVRSKRKKGRS